MSSSGVPSDRVRLLGPEPAAPGRDRVVYWMTAARRTRFNFALEHAISWSEELGLPLLVVETARCDGPQGTIRHLRFVLDGMAVNRERFADTAAVYHPYIAPDSGAIQELVTSLLPETSVLVTDDGPTGEQPEWLEPAGRASKTRLEAVDSCGLLPLATTTSPPGTALAFRRIVQRQLPALLDRLPEPDPLAGARLPAPPEELSRLLAGWPSPNERQLAGEPGALASLPVDHDVPEVSSIQGGAAAAEARLADFLEYGLDRYAEERNHPDAEVTSGLSPYLRWGHLAPHEVFVAVTTHEGWSPEEITPPANGRRSGWWGLSPGAEGFLDQLVTWRELGYAFSHHVAHPERWETLPEWSRQVLLDHADDPREHTYDLDELETAATHDRVWNAAQRQLRDEGVIHNYLRMIWGKRVVEWTRDPREALELLVHLNDRWALDGCDPNSYSGIGWCFGRFDRPWGPRRPIYGTVRYMSSSRTVKKLRLERWLERWGG